MHSNFPNQNKTCCTHATTQSLWPFIFGICWLVQAGLLIYAAKLPLQWAIPTVLVTLGLGHYTRIQLQSSKTLYTTKLLWAMLALGNIGMIIGWMADFGFGPLIKEGVCLCGCPISPIGGGLISKFGWMYKGMALASLPCFFIIRPASHTRFSKSFKNVENNNPRLHLPCKSISLRSEIFHAIACTVGMLLGMFIACKLLSYLPIRNAYTHFIYTYLFMTLGMALGMILPCKFFKTKFNSL